MPDVTVAGGDDASYFATMVATTLAQNVEQHPEKFDDFRNVDGDVVIEITDLDLSVTLAFRGDHCTVSDGAKASPKLRITTDADTFNGLGLVRIGPLGLPLYVDGPGRAVVKAMVTRRLRIGGMHHINTLNRVTRLFSVV
ncbi:MAG TPA: hypothetical protein VI316_06825 [Candidatus Dormibacteraeota bacterium]